MRNKAKNKRKKRLLSILNWWAKLPTSERIRKFKAYKEEFGSEAIGHEQLTINEITSIYAFID